MPEPDAESSPTPAPDGFRIRDLAGLVAGYGLAGFLLRSFAPVFATQGAAEAGVLVAFYLWLGLALSGPFVLALDRRGPAPLPRVATTHPPSRFAPEEMAWLGIGGYFAAIALFVVPSTQHQVPWGSILGVQAFVALWLVPWWLRRRSRRPAEVAARRWTRTAARVVLLTWPLAWLLLVLLVR